MPRTRKNVEGELNRLIDRLTHPYFKDYPALILLDGLLHFIVEQNPDVSLRKFVRYNAPELLRHLIRKRK